MSNFLRHIFKRLTTSKSRPSHFLRPPQLIYLEDRINPTPITVNTLQDTSVSDAFTSLREAIDLANITAGDDTIVFASSLFTNGPATISLTGVLPAIADATTAGTLTITGPGANTLNISANNGNFSVFSIVSLGNLSISGVTVSGANFTSGNGGAFNNAGVLAISASTISGNSATSGGGIFNQGTSLTISDSTISGNSASGFGGGINNFNGGTISVSNSTISNNSATNGGGGIINTSSTLTVSNSTLFGNTTLGNGGGILNATVSTGSSNLTVTNSTLSGNSALSGCGIQNNATINNLANTIIANSTSGGDFAGNAPNTNTNNLVETLGTVTGTFIPAFTADPHLGPLRDNSGPTFTMALGAGSPAIGTAAGTGTDQRGINRTTNDIGAYSFGIQVTSTADSGPGSLRTAMSQAGSTPGNDQISVNLTGTNPYTITLATSLPINDANTSINGGTAGTVTITGLGASNLTISGNGGNFSIFSIASLGNLFISEVTVYGANNSSGNGGAFNNSGILTVSNSIISGNSASFGGGIWNSGTLTVSDSTISGNSASQNGGGIYNNSSGVLNIYNSEISGNSASYGGGILTRGNLTISNSKLSANIANDGNGQGSGGGIRNEGALTILNSTLSGNTAYGGGGISNGSSLTISNSTFFENSATFGGGIENFGGTFSLNNSTLSGNSATFGGGAIYNRGVGTISNSTLSGNSANSGGGIDNFTGYTLNIANTIIANSTSGGDYAGGGTIGTNLNNLVEDGSITDTSSTPTGSGNISGDPLLGPLQNNGGPTQTLALLNGSVAIGAGNATISNASPISGKDQRGFARTTSDIGSYSYNFASAGDAVVSLDNSNQVVITLSSSGTTLSDVHTSFNSVNNTLTITAATSGTLLTAPAAGIAGITINSGSDTITLDLNTLVNFAGLVIVGNSGTDSITIGAGGVDLSAVTTGATNQSFTANILGTSNSTSALVLTNAIKTKGTAATYLSAGTINGSGLITTPSITMVALSGIGATTALSLASQAIAADSSNGKIIINNASASAVTVSSLTTKETTNEYDPNPPSYPLVTLIKFNQTGGGDVNLTNASTIGTTYPAAGEIELSNDGNLIVGAGGVVSDGVSNIYIQTTNLGNIVLNGNVDASRGDGAISLKSAGSISGTGALISGSFGRLDDLIAGTGIDVKTQGLDFSLANISTTTGNISIENTTLINLPAIAAPANLSIKAGGTISQSGAITVVGTASFHAANGAIDLINIGNDFNGAVSLTNTGAFNVAIVDIDDITIDVTSLGTGTFAVTGSNIKLNNNVTTTNNSQTYTGDVVVNANSGGQALVVLSAGSGAISITGNIDSATGQNYSLTLTSTDDVTIGGTTGGIQALGSLLITGNDISLGNIGGANVGTTSNVSVQASDGADNGSITLTGTTYNTTGQQFYNSSSNAVHSDGTRPITLTEGNSGSTINMTTEGASSNNAVEFTGLLDLNGHNLSIDTTKNNFTTGGDITFNQTVNGVGTLTLNAGSTGIITASGTIGATTPLTGVTITNAASAAFSGSIHTNNLTITDTTNDGFVRFLGNLTVNTGMTVSPNGAYNVEILELSNVAGQTTFGNSGLLTLGNAGSDVFNFTGGIIATNPSAINLIGTITAAGAGIITLGDSDTPLNVKSGNGAVGGASTGIITLGNAILDNGVTLTVGTGIANVINMAVVTGTASGKSSNLTINTTGAVTVTGAIGTDIGTVTITNSGGTTFQSTVVAATATITNTTGIVKFEGNLNLTTSLITANQGYNVSITGTSNNIAGATTFLNTGTVTLGNGTNDSTTFAGGLVITAPSSIPIQGTVRTTNTTMTLGDANTGITNNGTFSNPAILNAGAGIINLAGNVTGNGSNNPLKVTTSGVGFTTVSGVNDAELQFNSGVVTIANPSDQTGGYRVSGGTLQGGSMAKVGYIYAQTGTSTLAPGINGPGMMHTNSLLLSSGNTVEIDLQGTNPATGYDQIVVCKSGSVDLASATLALTSTITPASGTVFTIIDNQDSSAISGTFAGLAQGATVTANGRSYQISYIGGTGNDVTLTSLAAPTPTPTPTPPTPTPTPTPPPPTPTPSAPLVIGTPPPPSSGGSSTVTLYDPVTGQPIGTAVPFPGFSGPITVVSGDFNGDGVAEIIAGAGFGGGPAIAILNSQTGEVMQSFFAFDPAFTGGVFVAVRDTNGDGILDIIAGAGPGGGPEVRIFNGANLNVLRSFFAYAEDFRGGVSVATIDFNNDGILDLVTGAGPGGGPHVKVFDGATNAIISQWYAYPVSFSGGVYVAAGDIGNDGNIEVVTGAGSGGAPVVAVWDPYTGALLSQFMAYAEDFTGGVRVGVSDGNFDGVLDLITGAGPGGGPQVNGFSFPTLDLLFSFFSGDPANTGGVFVS